MKTGKWLRRGRAWTLFMMLLWMGVSHIGCSDESPSEPAPSENWVGTDTSQSETTPFTDVEPSSSTDPGEDLFPEEDPSQCTDSSDCASVPSLGPCFAATCVSGVCEVLPLGDGTACTTDELDADLCVIESVCDQGQCSPLPVFCDDNDPCTQDSCNPNTGACQFENIGEGCGPNPGKWLLPT